METKTLQTQLKERLNSLEDAFNETGRPRVNFSVYPEDLRVNREAEYNAIVIVEAARKIEKENGYGEIDWIDYNQWKYIPWFRMSPSSFGFGDAYYAISFASAGSGSRLRLLSKEATSHIGSRFSETWENLQLG